jgi:cobalt-zinc-cadmium efflux system outer membrane protein
VRVIAAVVASFPLAVPAGGQVVREQDFLAGISEGHPALAATGRPLVEAEAALQRARTLSNPFVEALYEDPQEVARQTTVTLSWTPPLDGRRGVGIRAAEAGVAAAEKRTAAARLRVELEARAVYADWAAASALARVVREQAERMAELARRVRARAEAGEESALAAGRLDLAAAEARAELHAADTAAALTSALARAWRPDLPAEAAPELPSLRPGVETSTSLALEALERETERARLQEKLAGRFWTFPALQAGFQRQHHDSAAGPVLGVAWTVPLFDRNQAGRHEARRNREIAETELRWTSTRLAAAVEGRRRALEIERRAVEDADRAAALAPSLAKAAAARFEAGEATVTELVEATGAARAAERRAIETRSRALAAERAVAATLAGLAEGGDR